MVALGAHLSARRFRSLLLGERSRLAATLALDADTTIAAAFQSARRFTAALGDDVAPEALRAFRLESPFRDGAAIVDRRGRVLVSEPATMASIPPEWLTGAERVTPLVERGGRSVVCLLQPFRAAAEERVLVLEAAVTAPWLSQLVGIARSEGGLRARFLDLDGVVVAAADPEELGRRVLDPASFHESIEERHAWARSNTTGALAEESTVSAFAPLAYAPWGALLEQPTRDAEELLRTARATLVGLALLIGVAGVFLGRSLFLSLIEPVRRLSREAEALRGGDFGRPFSSAGDREIATLGETLEDARRRLAASLQQVELLNQGLEGEVARRTAEIRALLEETRAGDEERRRLLRRLLHAGEEERTRIARELHDEIAQLLTAIELELAGDAGPERIAALLARTQAEVHRVIHDLRPGPLAELGLAGALRDWLREQLDGRTIRATVAIDDEIDVTPEVEIAAYRVAQELVTNVLRHAGAEQISIDLRVEPGRLILDVEDDGRGFDPARSAGTGLTGIRERAALVDGRVTVESEPGSGTQARLEVPLP